MRERERERERERDFRLQMVYCTLAIGFRCLLPRMYDVLNTGFVYCKWNIQDYLIRLTECLLVSMKMGRIVEKRGYEKFCVKLAFILYGYNRVLEMSNHFCAFSSEDV